MVISYGYIVRLYSMVIQHQYQLPSVLPMYTSLVTCKYQLLVDNRTKRWNCIILTMSIAHQHW